MMLRILKNRPLQRLSLEAVSRVVCQQVAQRLLGLEAWGSTAFWSPGYSGAAPRASKFFFKKVLGTPQALPTILFNDVRVLACIFRRGSGFWTSSMAAQQKALEPKVQQSQS